MQNIPIPKTRAGVLSSLILTVLLLAFYYLFMFSRFLLPSYNEQFYRLILYEEKENSLGCEDIQTYARIPKFVYENGRQWIYISFYNASDQTIRNIYARFVLLESDANGDKSQDEYENNIFLLPSFFVNNVTDSYIEIKSIEPKVKIYGRFDFATRGSFSVNNTRIIISCEKKNLRLYGEKQPTKTISPAGGNIDAFLHTTLENLLLPPWSNAVVPAFAVLSSWLFETENFKSKENTNGKNKRKNKTVNENSAQNAKLGAENDSSVKYLLDEIFRITSYGLVFNMILWTVFVVSVRYIYMFEIVLFLLVAIPIIYTFLNNAKVKKFLQSHKILNKTPHGINPRSGNSIGAKTVKEIKEKNAQSQLVSEKDKSGLSVEKEPDKKDDVSFEKHWCANCGLYYEGLAPDKCKQCGKSDFQDYEPFLN